MIIERRIFIEAKYLDSNIMTNIFNKLVEITKDECTKECGYIISIKRLIKIISSEDTVFKVQFEAETFKPEVGQRIKGIVCKVYKDGIFVDILNKQKMLIPLLNLSKKSYKFEDNIYRHTINTHITICEGDEIETEITAARYNRKYFSCIGSLV